MKSKVTFTERLQKQVPREGGEESEQTFLSPALGQALCHFPFTILLPAHQSPAG